MNIEHSPVALFVYNRLDNTRKTVTALQQNKLATETELYIFSDGGKDEKSWKLVNEVREYLKTIEGFKCVHLVFRQENFYLERNITEGIAEVLNKHDCVIVLEDDIVTSPWFLTYMNDALNMYKNESRVWHIAGFTNLNMPELGSTYFCHHMSGWGWATWRDRWLQHFKHFSTREEALKGVNQELQQQIEMNGHFRCLHSLNKRPIPWDICWEIAIYKGDALCLHPTQTLVRNVGLNCGTHFSQSKIFGWYDFDREPLQKRVMVGNIEIAPTNGIDLLLEKALTDHGIRYNWFGRIVRYVYLRVTGKYKDRAKQY